MAPLSLPAGAESGDVIGGDATAYAGCAPAPGACAGGGAWACAIPAVSATTIPTALKRGLEFISVSSRFSNHLEAREQAFRVAAQHHLLERARQLQLRQRVHRGLDGLRRVVGAEQDLRLRHERLHGRVRPLEG